MALGQILVDKRLVDAFIYEGERIGLQYPDGTVEEIPSNKIYIALRSAIRFDGEECQVLLAKSPVTRMDIVPLEEHMKATTAHG